MKNTTVILNLRFLLLALVGLLCSLAHADEVNLVIAAKEQRFLQTNSAAPVLTTNLVERFGVFVYVQLDSNAVITSLVVSNAIIGSNSLDGAVGGFIFNSNDHFPTLADLDNSVRPGSYTFHITTANGSNFTATVNIPASAYPNAPHVANWTEAQNIDPFADFTLRWDPMTGGSAQDYIRLSVSDYNSGGGGDSDAFASPFLLQPGALTGTSNSIVIPTAKLEGGKTYNANLTFVNVVSANTNIIPGAFIGFAFVKETEFTITTETIPAGGRIQFANTNIVVNESNGTAEVNIVRVGGSEGSASFDFATIGLTATAGLDYTTVSNRYTFENGSSNLTIVVPILNDFLLEGPERVHLSLSNPDGATLTRNTNAIVTITDNESAAAGQLSFSAATYQVVEASNATVKVIVRRAGGTTGAVGATIDVIGGTATYDTDYDVSPGETGIPVSIPAGQNASTNDISILDDLLPEGDETIVLRLHSPTGGAILGKITTNTLTILDDESSFAFEVARSTNVENQATAKITVLRNGSTLTAASVDYAASVEVLGFAPAVDAPYATSGVDFLGTTGTISFPKGVAKKNFTVKILDDLSLEGDEAIRLTLRNPIAAQLGGLSNALLYIKDNDLAGTVNFVMTNQNVKESVGDAKIMVIRTGGLASNIMVRLSTQAGTATDSLDYQGFTTNLVFSGREVKKTIPLSVFQDAIVESTENLTLTLSTFEAAAAGISPAGISGQYADLGTKTTLTVNIADDDKGGMISFDKAALSVNESVTNLAIILKRTGGAASNVTVRLQSANGPLNPATAGSDYSALDTVVTFGPGETRKTNYLHIINDNIADAIAPETIALSLREFTGGAKPGNSNAVVAIIDDESSVSFASATSSGVENRTVTITVVRSGFPGSTSTVEYMFMNGTATNGLDFTGVNGTLTFLPRQILKTIIVPIISDPNAETNRETFTVILKNATNALPGEITTNTVSITDAPAVGAIPLAGPEFLTAVTKGVTNSSFNRSITINDGGIDFIQLSSIGDNYGIQARDNFFSPIGSEAFLISINGVTGPGIFNVTPNNLQAALEYNRGTESLSGNFDFNDDDAGTIGTITVEASTATPSAGASTSS